ncbi:hypothetical protein Dimus_019161 [Dionaea muscipula]
MMTMSCRMNRLCRRSNILLLRLPSIFTPVISRHKSGGGPEPDTEEKEHGGGDFQERAPSTAEVMRQMLEEKERQARWALNALEEAIADDPQVVEEKYKQASRDDNDNDCDGDG